MLYEDIVAFAEQNIRKNATKDTKPEFAVEFNICGEGEGAFYVAVKKGKVVVEPYEYYDRDIKIVGSAEELTNIFSGKKTIAKSFAENQIRVEGNIDIMEEFEKLIKKGARSQTTKNKADSVTEAEKTIVEKTKKKDSKVAKDIKK